ncbi:hypothetical protein ACHQM5_005997 [Ranunculus cassubicifolius]
MAVKAFQCPVLVLFLLLLAMFMSPPLVLCKSNRNSFAFLQHLEGCHKGQNLKGVNQLKQYLKKFGYLDHSSHVNNDDEYDDLLESAVKTYQLNHHLKQTGSLNSETLNEMMKPRCGVADIIDGSTRMGSGKNKPSSLRTVSHFSFLRGDPPPRWPASQTHLTYRFNSTVDVVDVQTLRSVVSQAFAKWEAVSQFTFTEATGSDSDIEIGFQKRDHGDNAPFSGTGDVLAHAYPPTIGVFHYDADESWSTNPDSSRNEFDLESIAVHEIGHLLGLGHSEFSDAVMWGSYDAGATRRELTQDDIQGIRTLYGISP